MVKYTLLHKPTLSTWPSIPRQIRTIIIGVVLITLTFLIIVQSSRNAKLRDLYETKSSTAEILDLELKYMPEVPDSEKKDRWLQTSVKDGIIFSAYLDTRPEIILDDSHHDRIKAKTWAVIRIIAILPTDISDRSIFCNYKYRDGEEDEEFNYVHKKASRVKPMKEHWNLKYSAFFVLCDLSLPIDMNYVDYYYDRHLPMKVSLTTAKSEDPEHLKYVNVHYPINGINQINDDDDQFLAVCGPVFHHEYDKPLNLVEWIEYYSMLGAGHFTFYNNSLSPEVSKVLSYYEKKDIATTFDWKLPSIYIYELTLRRSGMFAALNDCLYRSSFYKNYKYILVADVDEFIVPKIDGINSFKDLINYLEPDEKQQASLKFKNVFFYSMYADDKTDYDPAVPRLNLQAKTERVESTDDIKTNGKYIARSENVVELGSHNVWKYRDGSSIFSDKYGEGVVKEDVALSHHYRYCEAETAACYFRKSIIDRSGHRFIKELGQRVAKTCTAIFGKSGCPVPATNL